MPFQSKPIFEGQWIPHLYPLTPPIKLYFRISTNGKYRQYQTRYTNQENHEENWENTFIPFPNDNYLRDFED